MSFNVRKVLAAAVLAVLVPGMSAPAAIIGPYAADANTVALFHLDEDAGSVATPNAGTLGKNAYAINLSNASTNPSPTVATILGAAAYSGFGKAANLTGAASHALGFDYGGNNEFNPQGAADEDILPHSVLIGGTDKSFTFDALVYFPSSLPGNGNYQIIATDRNGTGDVRGFGWRINVASNVARLQLNLGGIDDKIGANLPTSGDHAFAADTWFHAAVAYNGSTNTLTQYWTKLDPSVTAAVQLGASVNPASFDPVLATQVPLVLGGENRGANGEGLRSLLDEVRISNVARGAGDYIFVPEPTTILMAGLGCLGIAALARRRQTG